MSAQDPALISPLAQSGLNQLQHLRSTPLGQMQLCMVELLISTQKLHLSLSLLAQGTTTRALCGGASFVRKHLHCICQVACGRLSSLMLTA